MFYVKSFDNLLLEAAFWKLVFFFNISSELYDYVTTMDEGLGELVSNCGLAFDRNTVLSCF